MALELFAHPFSSYCQKALIALYEHDIPFTFRLMNFDGSDPGTLEEFAARWPLKRMPLLVDDGRAYAEATIIIEHLETRGPARLIPAAPEAAIEARFLDRFFDNYIHTPLQKLVFDVLRPEPERDARGVAEARALLDTAYAWLEDRIAGKTWALGDDFTLADCSAGPALFYADWGRPIPETLPAVRAYRARLNGRPSFARAIEEGRPFRPFFPLGAPDRD